MLTPREIEWNSELASHSGLIRDPGIPVFLHICHESREFALQQYKLYNLGPRQLYLHPVLDVVLWIRYYYKVPVGPLGSEDAQRLLLHEPEQIALVFKQVISVTLWNRSKKGGNV
jgi:hypothetical protein